MPDNGYAVHNLKRRDLLKLLSLAPLLSVSHPFLTFLLPSIGSCKCINILLHGLFFMEFQKDEHQNNMLVVASPCFQDHRFCWRDHGSSNLQPFSGLIDLRGPLASGAGSRDDFPDRILNFSWKAIRSDPSKPYFIDRAAVADHACILLLPVPVDIAPLRSGLRTDLHALNGKVLTSIHDGSGSDHVALITRIKYGLVPHPPFGNNTRSFYSEHCGNPSPCEVNQALQAASDCFTPDFDFRLALDDTPKVDRDQEKDLPDEIKPDDEQSLYELQSCPQPDTCLQRPPKVCIEAVEVANCPTFGVTA